MLAAVGCTGKTRILNAAREPEIEDLQNFLISMGARITGAGSSTIEIEGTQATHNAEHNVIPDRIVAATYLIAAAVTGGEVLVEQMNPEHISTVISLLEYAGCDLRIGKDYAIIKRVGEMRAISTVRTMPYPGFPTDAQAPMMVLATQAMGTSVFVENIFDNRYRHVCELARMGANIRVEGKLALVTGRTPLSGAAVASTDLRGGAALVIAALGARGESVITDIRHIDRGYERIEEAFSLLGARIRREEE